MPTTSASEQSKILAAAFVDIKPPKHIALTRADILFFTSIISERANAEWSDHEIAIAAMMSRALGNLEREERLLRKEGILLKTKQTKYPILNPRKGAVQNLTDSVLAYRRSLSLHIRAGSANPADVSRRKKNAKEIQELAQDFDDDLIARPGVVN